MKRCRCLCPHDSAGPDWNGKHCAGHRHTLLPGRRQSIGCRRLHPGLFCRCSYRGSGSLRPRRRWADPRDVVLRRVRRRWRGRQALGLAVKGGPQTRRVMQQTAAARSHGCRRQEGSDLRCATSTLSWIPPTPQHLRPSVLVQPWPSPPLRHPAAVTRGGISVANNILPPEMNARVPFHWGSTRALCVPDFSLY